MKMIILFLMSALLFANKVQSQKTPADFGNTAFWCFQHNRTDSLFKLLPTLQDLSGFAKEMGIVEGSPAYQSFLNRYPLVIKSFKDKCYQIQHDSLDYKFSWINAKLEKLEPVERTITPDNMPNKKPVLLTGLNIYFLSKGQSYILKFGDLHQYGGVWKPGNNISLTIQYN
jgi:hypothetical protein